MDTWKKCNICGKKIPYGAQYQQCSVSSCKKFAYCSVDCWDMHLSVTPHKNAWCEEVRAPKRVLVHSKSTPQNSDNNDILIVASRLKQFVSNISDMNTSSSVMEKLSDIVRAEVRKATENAKSQGRKTLMDRDFI